MAASGGKATTPEDDKDAAKTPAAAANVPAAKPTGEYRTSSKDEFMRLTGGGAAGALPPLAAVSTASKKASSVSGSAAAKQVAVPSAAGRPSEDDDTDTPWPTMTKVDPASVSASLASVVTDPPWPPKAAQVPGSVRNYVLEAKAKKAIADQKKAEEDKRKKEEEAKKAAEDAKKAPAWNTATSGPFGGVGRGNLFAPPPAAFPANGFGPQSGFQAGGASPFAPSGAGFFAPSAPAPATAHSVVVAPATTEELQAVRAPDSQTYGSTFGYKAFLLSQEQVKDNQGRVLHTVVESLRSMGGVPSHHPNYQFYGSKSLEEIRREDYMLGRKNMKIASQYAQELTRRQNSPAPLPGSARMPPPSTNAFAPGPQLYRVVSANGATLYSTFEAEETGGGAALSCKLAKGDVVEVLEVRTARSSLPSGKMVTKLRTAKGWFNESEPVAEVLTVGEKVALEQARNPRAARDVESVYGRLGGEAFLAKMNLWERL